MGEVCNHLPPQPSYQMTFKMDQMKKVIAADWEETIAIFESHLCGWIAEVHFIISETGGPDNIELYYPGKYGYMSGVQHLKCMMRLHVDSLEALDSFNAL